MFHIGQTLAKAPVRQERARLVFNAFKPVGCFSEGVLVVCRFLSPTLSQAILIGTMMHF